MHAYIYCVHVDTCVTEQLDQTDAFENKIICDSSIAFDNPGNPYLKFNMNVAYR